MTTSGLPSEVLLLPERVKNTIALGESHFREFKTALEGRPDNKKPRPVKKICEDIAEALVAFANADGGELIIGVEDDRTITGIPHNQEDIKIMLSAPISHVHAEHPLPLTFSDKLQIDGYTVLFFSVAKSSEQIFQLPDGTCIRRKDKETVPATFRQIQFERQEVRSREYDRQFVDGAHVGDLDVEFVQSIANQYISGLSVERYLQQMGLAEYHATIMRLRRAALLLFARNPQKCSQSQVRILRVVGTELKSGTQYNVSSDETIQGNIFQLVQQSWEQLRQFLVQKTEFGTDARFEQKYIYPEGVCREALINAIAHRDYSSQNGIEVYIFDDRIEIKNPGALLSTITVEDLKRLEGAHESRNALIARVLRENKYMRELGEGMKRMFELMEAQEFQVPDIHSNTYSFTVTLSHRSLFTPKQEQWLLLFEPFQLSNYQRRIVALGMEGRQISSNDIYKVMKTDDRNIYDREVTSLRTRKILREIRGKIAATQYSRAHKIPRDKVPRFEVQIPPGIHIDQEEEKKVYVSNLPYQVSEADILELFKRFGEVVKIYLPKDLFTSSNRGFGFVEFSSAESAKSALSHQEGLTLSGHKLLLKKALQRPRRNR